jgi:hypothetical protein
MAVILAGGIEIDIATKEDLKTLLAQQTKQLAPPRPWVRNLDGAYSTPTPAPAVSYLDGGGPKSGRIWEVQRIAVCPPADIFTTLAGVTMGLVLASRKPQDGATLAGADQTQVVIAGPGSQVPNTAPFGPHQLMVRYPYRLIVIVRGLVAGQGILLSGQILDYDDTLYSP